MDRRDGDAPATSGDASGEQDLGRFAHVFAYGSNLFPERMTGRVPSAEMVGRATLTAHALRFHLRSVDGSGKANAFFTGNPDDRVEGVVYRILTRELRTLDRYEGRYVRKLHRLRMGDAEEEARLEVELPVGSPEADAWCYHAFPDRIEPDARPFDWYHELVVEGARRHGLPEEYAEALARVPVVPTGAPGPRERMGFKGPVDWTGLPSSGPGEAPR